jgi:hypothetical protein
MSEVLSEHIRGIVNPWDKEQFNLFKRHHCISYKVILDVDVFGALFGNWILCYKKRSLIVTTDGNRGKIVPDFLKHLFDPDDLARAVAQSHILSLSRGECSGFLQVGIPKENSIRKLKIKAHLRVTSDFVLTPVRVSACDDAFARITVVDKRVIGSTK